jgi:deazaflavin-dependent oxidoreductase (nitroreductase family)
VTRRYRLTPLRRLANLAVTPLIRLGLAGAHTYVLTVRGRKTGRPYSTPVRLIEDGGRWLVAPYGEVGWVRNARAAGEITLRRAGRSQRVRIEEVGAAEAAPVLREYVRRVAIVRPFFEAGPDATLAEFESEAGHHPVFRLVT